MRYIGGINDQWFLLAADLKAFAHVETHVWQVRHDTQELRLIEEDPYFTFDRPPRIWKVSLPGAPR